MVLALIVCIIVLFILGLKTKIYQTPARLVNITQIEDKLKWELISRWGP